MSASMEEEKRADFEDLYDKFQESDVGDEKDDPGSWILVALDSSTDIADSRDAAPAPPRDS